MSRTVKHSASLTASNVLVNTNSAKYYGFAVSAATATAAILIRDSSSAGSGTIIDAIPASSAIGYRTNLANPVQCTVGLTVDFNGGTGTVVIYYE